MSYLKTIRRIAILIEFLQLKADVFLFGYCEEVVVRLQRITIVETAYRLARRKGYKVFTFIDTIEVNGRTFKRIYQTASI